MRQGWCMLLLLLAGSLEPAMAVEVSEQEVKQAATSPQVQNRVAALTTLYDRSDFRAWSLTFPSWLYCSRRLCVPSWFGMV